MLLSIAKRLGTALFYPSMILMLPFIAMGVAIVFFNATLSGLFQRAQWLRGLRESGRATPAADLLDRIQGGTLIVDRPGFNFKSTHCWWTDESVAAVSPVPIPTDDERMELCTGTTGTTPHEFDLWCWQRYISPLTGSATLVSPPHHGAAMAAVIQRHFPTLGCINSWSAPAAIHVDS